MFRLYSLLFTLILVGHSSAQSFGQRIFWNEPTNNRIQVGALSAGAISGPQTLAPGIANLEDIAIAPSSGYIFYIQATSGLVRASLVDGSGTFVLRDFGAFTGFNDIAYSGNANGVFTPLIEEEHGASFFDESSGSETQLTLGGFNNDDYVAVTVHDGNEEVFFINDDQQGIFKCPDFSCNSLIQIIGQTGLECLTDDEFNNKIYFTATSGPTTMLYSANLDGSALTGLADLGSAYITSIQAYSKIGKIYYVKYNDGIYSVDIDGNNSNTLVLSLAGTGVTDIAIEPDLTPPVLTGTSPEDNAVNVTNNESLSLNFDGKVFISSTAGTANEQSIRIYETVGNVLVQTIDRSSSDISISLNLASVFNITTPKINTEYYVLIGSKVFRDNANNDYTGISSNTTWNFKTTPGVTVSAPSATTCTGTYVTLPDIVITEVANSDFSQGANQTLVLTAGSGYTFEPGTGTVTFGSGADISAASIVVTASDVTVTYSVDLIAGADALTISGLKFTTSSSTNPGADITRTGGTGVIAGLANGRVVGSTYSQTGSSAPTGTYPNGTNLCAGFDLSQTLIDITGAAVKWYTDAGLTLEQVPMAGVTNATGTALGIDNNTPATYTYYVTQTSGGCESAATMFSFTVNALPPAYDQTATVCSSSANDVDLTVHHAAITEGAPNTIVEWFDDAGLTNPIADPTSAAVVDTQMLHAKVTNTLSACTAQATVTFTVDDGPVVADQTFQVCEGVAGSGSAVVDLTTYDGTLTDGAANLTVAWLDISNNPIGSPAAETVTDGEVFHGRVTNTTTTCSTIANGTFDILQLPTTADAGPDQTVCGGAAVLAANTPTVGTGVWSIVSGGAGTFVSTSNPNTTFTPSGGTNYTLRWTITNATCTPSTNDVIIQFTTPPTMAAAGPDQQVCGTSAGLAGNTPTVGTGAWTIVSGVGGTITSPANPTSGFTGVVGTTYVLRWTITNGSCTPSFDEVTIQHLALPSVAAAGPDQNVCGTGATLAGNTPAVGTGAWSIISGSGGTIANPASPTSGFTGAAGTNYTLRWTISAACTSTEDDVVIQLSAAPSTAVAGSDQTVCTTTVALGATTPAVGSGLWSIVSGAGGNIATPSSPTSGFTGVTGTTYVVRWTVSNGGCTPSTDDVSISLITTPTTAAAGPDQNICGTS
ncbi:MAG: Ig-like domain-containing protein, partial [Bacteroidota bacterium]